MLRPRRKSLTLPFSMFNARSKAAASKILDIDSADKDNDHAAVEYVENMYAFYKEVEPCNSGIQPSRIRFYQSRVCSRSKRKPIQFYIRKRESQEETAAQWNKRHKESSSHRSPTPSMITGSFNELPDCKETVIIELIPCRNMLFSNVSRDSNHRADSLAKYALLSYSMSL
ncbi:hypothetical protein Bca4012_056034 [Brassica carinata]|uniref:Uncharacterized protein n=1 Tax=Brassica carinata TaxID=52824 RepID=A0A8X8B455_BRACI|nr:hypothetical protein Bca52824_014160 [Brassica carinata]